MPSFSRPNGLTLSYEIDDFTDPWRKAPYLILQHGNGRSARFWYRWVPYLSRFYKVIRPDMRGLGKSVAALDLDRDMTVDALIDDLTGLLDHLGAEQVHYCGESTGGILGIALSARRPERIKTLTLVSAPVFIEDSNRERYALGHGSALEAAEKLGVRTWAEATTKSTRIPADTDPELCAWFVDELVKGNADVQAAMTRMIHSVNVTELLPAVRAPVLGLYPTGGHITTDSQEKLLKEGLRNFTLIHLPLHYHMVHLIYPATCTREVLRFCAEHDGHCVVDK